MSGAARRADNQPMFDTMNGTAKFTAIRTQVAVVAPPVGEKAALVDRGEHHADH
jgi:hypothetical protein